MSESLPIDDHLKNFLARCPFCACADIYAMTHEAMFWMYCRRCESGGPLADSLDRAYQVWNKRYRPEEFDWRYSKEHTGQ